ncbi:MAG: hypothetical protein HQL06_10820 [Nitrospirae bacterium]|nr:hypothetical protein [Nitrospirota bacterium]
MKSDKYFSKLSSYDNLDIAWKQIKTAQNVYYKNYYRQLFMAYDFASEQNIESLSIRLKGRSYEPSNVLKFYLPKPSGLHRPITFLHLDDLIVYQAIVSVLASKFKAQRKEVENISVFSNILNSDDKKPLFFFRKWQEGYARFKRKIKDYFDNGNVWASHFDLAAYYDTIDHSILIHQISPKNIYEDFIELMKKCLNCWSTHTTNRLSHGIPQGPISSAFIAEIYFLPIDRKIVKNLKYVRYVDDIKIFGKSEEEVQEGIIFLEHECKERGLIPQSKKFSIIKCNTLEDAIGKEQSLSSEEKDKLQKDPKETFLMFKNAFDSDNNVLDISKVRYILKSSGKNDDILHFVSNIIKRYPDLVDEFSSFFINYLNDLTSLKYFIPNVYNILYHINMLRVNIGK